jgi:hypothetical protein
MATKTKTDTVAEPEVAEPEVTTPSLLGDIEVVPKREGGNITGRVADADKVAHLHNIFSSFAEFAAANPMQKGQQVPVNDTGKWTPTQLATLGNSMLKRQADNGAAPGFYLLACNLEHQGETKTGKPKMVATKLVIRAGEQPKRNRKNKPETT